MINLWFGIFLIFPKFIVVWGGIAGEVGIVLLLLKDGKCLLLKSGCYNFSDLNTSSSLRAIRYSSFL